MTSHGNYFGAETKIPGLTPKKREKIDTEKIGYVKIVSKKSLVILKNYETILDIVEKNEGLRLCEIAGIFGKTRDRTRYYLMRLVGSGAINTINKRFYFVSRKLLPKSK